MEGNPSCQDRSCIRRLNSLASAGQVAWKHLYSCMNMNFMSDGTSPSEMNRSSLG